MINLLRTTTIIFLTLLCFSCEKEESSFIDQNSLEKNNDNSNLLVSKASEVIEITADYNNSYGFYRFRPECGTNYRMSRGVELILGWYLYTLQNDGNFVCYNLKKAGLNPDKKYDFPVWATDTQGKAVQYIYFQEDGNIVAYDKKIEKVFWSSNKYGDCGFNVFLFNKGGLGVLDYSDPETIKSRYKAVLSMPTINSENFY